jgi:FlaA1/EpsC-like NDP-sugar epimerase
VIGIKAAVFCIGGLHRGWGRYASLSDLCSIFVANAVSSIALTGTYFLPSFKSLPRSVYLIDFLLCFLLTGSVRFAVRFYKEVVKPNRQRTGHKKILVYGAGQAGITLAQEIRRNPRLNYEVIGFLDDDPAKLHARMMGVTVLGSGRDLFRILIPLKQRNIQLDEIIVAMPAATAREMRDAVANCRASGITCKSVPGVADMLTGKVLSSQIQDIAISDLLGREPVRLEEDKISGHIAGRSVLVTGGAGSIGSELSRQIAAFRPSKLVVFDQAESDLYRIELELRGKYPNANIEFEIGDIQDIARVEHVMHSHQTQIVFHAAAYKHVPLMEAQICEAVKNNIFGTWNVIKAAKRQGVSSFVMISSDKAVNPTSVMGVTKRVAELLVSATSTAAADRGTKLVSVRFGNVLGSNGSVTALFQQQIKSGGPVTVTDPEMRRYFMTTREAVQLVLQAATMGKGSELFVLDMGEPVLIADLAKNMIRLAGLEPDEDIEVRYVGLRPGEKLFEEITFHAENVKPTYHDKIKIFECARPNLAFMEQWLAELRIQVNNRDEAAILNLIKSIVPEYLPAQRTVSSNEPNLAIAVSAS